MGHLSGHWSATATTMASHGAASFNDEDGNCGQSGEAICPRDVEGGVEDESGKSDESEVGASGGLDGVSGKRVVVGLAREDALLPREHRHDDQGRDGDGNSERAGFGVDLSGEGKDGREGNNRCKDEEKPSGGIVDVALAEAETGSEGHDNEGGGEEFDKTVSPEG